MPDIRRNIPRTKRRLAAPAAYIRAHEANRGNAASITGLQNSGKQTSSAVRVRAHRQLGLGLVEKGHKLLVSRALHHAATPRGGMR